MGCTVVSLGRIAQVHSPTRTERSAVEGEQRSETSADFLPKPRASARPRAFGGQAPFPTVSPHAFATSRGRPTIPQVATTDTSRTKEPCRADPAPPPCCGASRNCDHASRHHHHPSHVRRPDPAGDRHAVPVGHDALSEARPPQHHPNRPTAQDPTALPPCRRRDSGAGLPQAFRVARSRSCPLRASNKPN